MEETMSVNIKKTVQIVVPQPPTCFKDTEGNTINLQDLSKGEIRALGKLMIDNMLERQATLKAEDSEVDNQSEEVSENLDGSQEAPTIVAESTAEANEEASPADQKQADSDVKASPLGDSVQLVGNDESVAF